MAAENIRVAVRVRPFNPREITRKATLIIGMQGNTTTIADPDNPKSDPKKFTFDYSYWSHDGCVEEADGYFKGTDPKYADQSRVFEDLGRGVLENAWKGYNCSLFAYGQTGSGKSYSMVGYGKNKGIVPVSSEELFKGVEEKREKAVKGEEYQVTFSMLEIYNEQVRDLLNPKSNVKGGLKVREKPNKGFYVDQLVTAPVNSYADIDGKIAEGTRNRTVAATNMNATSSRAHTIVTINFTQKCPNEAGESMTKQSSINLVDLAGSERAESTGATGDRLKEGSAINQSLSTLGNVIKALADASSGKKVIVPFRDSVLSKLLKNALGGNSKTIMIAALSPADINYDETLSTLRFADRAKAIKTTAVVNESPTDKLIRELREENAKLMEMLKKGGGVLPVESGESSGGSPEEIEAMKKQMEEEMLRNQEELDMMKKTWEERLAEQSKDSASKMEEVKKNEAKKKVTPHLWNLHEDPSLTAMVTHFCNDGNNTVGSNKAAKTPQILLNGLSILPEHAVITNKKGVVKLSSKNGSKILVNGEDVKKERELHHNDRVLFGSNHLYVFHHPQDEAAMVKSGKKPESPTYEKAQEEIAESSGLAALTGGKSGDKSKDELLLQEELIHLLPMVNESNAMSEELDKKAHFEVVLISPLARGLKEGRTEVCVKIKNLLSENEWVWDRNKFINRKYMMQEMYQNYVDGDKNWNVEKDQDPFWEPASVPVIVGTTQLFLTSIAFLIDNSDDLPITDYKGNTQGHLSVTSVPCDVKGKALEDEYVEDPKELCGKPLNFKINVEKANGISSRFEKTHCAYKFYLDEEKTKTDEKTGICPQYSHSKKITVDVVTQNLLDYFASQALVIEVWGIQKDVVKEKGKGADKTDKGKGTPAKKTTTKQLMDKEKDSEKQQLTSDLLSARRRAEAAEDKLDKIQKLMKSSKGGPVTAEALQSILNQSAKSASGSTMNVRSETMGGKPSQACTIQ